MVISLYKFYDNLTGKQRRKSEFETGIISIKFHFEVKAQTLRVESKPIENKNLTK